MNSRPPTMVICLMRQLPEQHQSRVRWHCGGCDPQHGDVRGKDREPDDRYAGKCSGEADRERDADASFEDMNGDDLLDLVVHGSTSALQVSHTDTETVLECETSDGTEIRGRDTARVVP